MKRRQLFFFLGCVPLACSKPPKDLVPAVVDGVWKRTASEPETNIPELVKKLGCRKATRHTYEGPRKLTVTVFEMTTSAGALEALQKWPVVQRTVPFLKRDLFVLVTGANDLVLAEFTSALEKSM